jgi:ribosomal protein S14
MARLLLKVKMWKRYELKPIIFKYYNTSNFINSKTKFLVNLKKWQLSRLKFISRQLNVCKITGEYKKTFNVIGASRHFLRTQPALNKLPHWKKLSW